MFSPLRTLHPTPPPERHIPQQHILLFSNPSLENPLETRAIIRMLIRLEHNVYMHQLAKTWKAVPSGGEAVPCSWETMAVVLDVGGCHLCYYKWNYGRGRGPILSAGAANCIEQFLLVSDVTINDVCNVGKCETLGELAGTTDD